MIDDILLGRLAKCLRWELRYDAGRKGGEIHHCHVYSATGHHVQASVLKGYPPSARVKLLAHNYAHVSFRTRKGETLNGLIWRALEELQKRERDGMPKPDPADKRRRQLRKMLHDADTVPM